MISVFWKFHTFPFTKFLGTYISGLDHSDSRPLFIRPLKVSMTAPHQLRHPIWKSHQQVFAEEHWGLMIGQWSN